MCREVIQMNKPENPCKNCGDRTVDCHGKCIKYQSFRDSLDVYNAKIKEAKSRDSIYTAYKSNKTYRR